MENTSFIKLIMSNEGIIHMNKDDILNNVNFNLSDFALFLSVMKNKKAYQNTLSIILDEDNIELKEVKVEQVVLNNSGKRAIRLDAWALGTDERQFNMEMENHSEKDSIPKRARFYQGLIDTPILKSGSKTKYKNLPATVIIFITQDDIFKKDLAKYTFREKCEEVENLSLDDGTTKIFLNMSSKNGSKELVSLLQYMKESRLDNPEILVKDKRIIELNEIVTEVKESEEWEGIRMNILDIGIEQGLQQGLQQGITAMIKSCKKLGASREQIQQLVVEEFSVTEEIAEEYIEMYW